uniref:Heat shock protein 70 n=1 Tax=Panagrolaimus sp. ES5 TaxID=591445 RepID=A0AC34GKJ6_9BILA
MSFEKHEALPTQQTIQFEKVSSQDKSLIVGVINDYTVIKEYSLPNMSNFVITVTIDINAIILVNYNDANCTDLIQTSPQPKNDPLKKLVLEDKKVDNDDGEYGHSLLGYDHEHPSENKSENGKNDFLLLKKITTYTENDVIGIDLGTSRCCAAVNRKNGIETVALDNKGERLLPSFIAY